MLLGTRKEFTAVFETRLPRDFSERDKLIHLGVCVGYCRGRPGRQTLRNYTSAKTRLPIEYKGHKGWDMVHYSVEANFDQFKTSGMYRPVLDLVVFLQLWQQNLPSTWKAWSRWWFPRSITSLAVRSMVSGRKMFNRRARTRPNANIHASLKH